MTPIEPCPVARSTSSRIATYWIVASPVAADTRNTWMRNVVGATGVYAADFGSGFQLQPSNMLAAFDVLGDPASVPEPSYSLMLIGLIILLCLKGERFP